MSIFTVPFFALVTKKTGKEYCIEIQIPWTLLIIFLITDFRRRLFILFQIGFCHWSESKNFNMGTFFQITVNPGFESI